MRTPKIIFTWAVAAIFVVIPATIFSQTEKLDIFEYTPPKGWTKTPKDGVMVYIDSNKTAGTFCVLSVYPSSQSAGSPQKDFSNEWNELIVKPFKTEANPKTENQTEDGWTTVSGAAQIEDNGIKSYVILTTLSGYGRVVSTYAILNDQSYLEQIGAFLTSVKMDKAKALAASKPLPPTTSAATTANNSAYLDFDPFPGMPGFQPPKPLLGRLRKTITMADLVGKWELGGASVTSYFNSNSGNYSSTDTSFFGQWYTIRANGTYDSHFQGRSSNQTIRESDTGTITLDGGFIIIKSTKSPALKNQFVAFMVQPDGAAILSLLYIGDGAPYNADQLRGNCNHTQGYISCMGGAEWVRRP